MNVRDHDGAVEGDDRRIIEFDQAIIKREDLSPVGRLIVLGGAVAGGDARLEMILGDLFTRSRPREVKHAPRDHRLIPARPVLFLEAQQVARPVQSSGNSRAIQQHQRQ